MGVQMPNEDRRTFHDFPDSSGFSYREESDNFAYLMFAGARKRES